jgi:protein gp37
MADNTGIEWTDATWNPVAGCSRVSEGCRNCYAERFSVRFSGPGQRYEGLVKSTPSGPRWTGKMQLVPQALDQPLRWKRPRRIFVNSMSDLFHEGLALDDILRVFEVMVKAKHHTFQVLTKRPERVLEFVRTFGLYPVGPNGETGSGSKWPANVWIGVSVENQAAADDRIPLLLKVPAAVRFLSCEPLLGHVDLLFAAYDGSESFGQMPGLHWVIAGGESGPGARPMHPQWARSLRDQCASAGVPFFFKQWGDWAPIDQPWLQESPNECGHNEQWHNLAGGMGFHGDEVWRMRRVGKRAAGNVLDGATYQAFPEVPNGVV